MVLTQPHTKQRGGHEMATTEEIEQRVEEADTARTARRAAAAKRVFELATRRATVAAQLSDLERELGDVLAEANDVIEIDELARFTDVPATDLRRWLDERKTTRPKRKRPAGTSAKNSTSPELFTAKPPPDLAVMSPPPAVLRVDEP
jgi:hypothetical protein